MFKLLHSCTHFTCQQSNAQNPSAQVSIGCEPKTSRYSTWIQKRQRNQRPNSTSVGSQKKLENSRKTFISASLTVLTPLTLWITTNCGKFLEMGMPLYLPPEKPVCRPRSQLEPYMEPQTGSNWERGRKGCILLICLFNFYTEYIM